MTNVLAEQYQNMLTEKSAIRELFDYARKRGTEIGYDNVFDYSLGNPSVPPPSKFTEKMIELLMDSSPMTLHGYSQTLGIPIVLETIADSLQRRFGLPYTAQYIFMTTGAAGAIAHALRAVTQKGDEVLTFAPYFSEYQPYVNLTGARLRVVPAQTKDFQIHFDALDSMITDKTKAILINTPNNPSGIVYSTETIQRLASLLTRKSEQLGHDIYLISDEPYREIVFEGVDAPYLSRYYANTLSCYSYSKSLSIPGERIGYIAANPACQDALTIIAMCGQISRGIGHNCPPSLIQLAVAGVVDQTSDLSVYERNSNILYEELVNLGFTCVKPGGTFYIFPKALEEDAVIFCEKAKKYDLILVPGDGFGCPGYFRMAYCMNTEKVTRSLAALRRFVQQEYYK